MRATIIGATGFVGKALCKELKSCGWEITILTRNADAASDYFGPGYRIIEWNTSSEIPQTALQNVDVIINLAGESIAGGRWTKKRKDLILESRILTTQRIVLAIERLQGDPKVLISASAVGFYGPRGSERICEDESGGHDFLAQVCAAWENAAFKAESTGTRVVALRIGVVLGKNGGALDRMIAPFKLFLGGPIGSGKQWLSWIHIDDLIGLVKFAAVAPSLRGPVNATAPGPVTMREFSKTLGMALNRPSWLPVPGLILKIALGKMSGMLLKGQRVIPCKAMEAGYEFNYETLGPALKAIFKG